jgi:hypothetical protein
MFELQPLLLLEDRIAQEREFFDQTHHEAYYRVENSLAGGAKESPIDLTKKYGARFSI